MIKYIIIGVVCFIVGVYIGMAGMSVFVASKDGKDDES